MVIRQVPCSLIRIRRKFMLDVELRSSELGSSNNLRWRHEAQIAHFHRNSAWHTRTPGEDSKDSPNIYRDCLRIEGSKWPMTGNRKCSHMNELIQEKPDFGETGYLSYRHVFPREFSKLPLTPPPSDRFITYRGATTHKRSGDSAIGVHGPHAVLLERLSLWHYI